MNLNVSYFQQLPYVEYGSANNSNKQLVIVV